MKRRILFCVLMALVSGARAGTVPDVCANAYLWLDASRTNTMSFSGDEITEWRSVNAGGVAARKYTQSAYTCSGPTLAGGLVSFGSTSANCDLGFAKSTAIRSVFMVAKVERSGNAFLLGDNSAYDFHRGGSGQYWHTGHSSANIRNGKTHFNGVEVTNPTSTTMPNRLGLIDVQAVGSVTASQLCYDRAGNGNVPRRGGKDIAEVLVFTNVLSEAEQRSVREYLMAKWNLFGVGGAEVVRAHPRLTLGLDKEALVGIKFTDGEAGALTNLTVRFDLTNCTPAQIRDVRVWRQKYDPIPYAFYERDAIELALESKKEEGMGNKCGFLTIHFSNSNLASNTIYPKSGTMAEGDYVWITAKIDEAISTNAEIWASIAGDRVQLASGDFRLANQVAKSPHRPFPYKCQVAAFVRQDRLVGRAGITSDIFSNHPEERMKNLTTILPIYSLGVTYSGGKFGFGNWIDGDTASTRRIVDLKNQYHPQAMVCLSLTAGSWVSNVNGINGFAFEAAGASEATRRQFASYVVDFIETHRCDGLDVDYEWATRNNRREWQNIGRMLREFSEQFFDHGYVVSIGTRNHQNADSGMPLTTDIYGALHPADFILAQAYDGGHVQSAPCIQRSAIAVGTDRGVPKRRMVVGQAIYSSPGQWGWDGAIPYLNKVDDLFHRYDIDCVWTTKYTECQPFEGVSSFHAQCGYVRREELGGVMSWGYYCDIDWWNQLSLGRHQSQAIWPMPFAWPEPEKVEKVGGGGQWIYLLKDEEDWFWLEKHPGVKARFANDITLAHDPVVIDCWTGELDGNGHSLTLTNDAWVVSEKSTGLVRTLRGTVKNLKVELNGRVYTTAARWNDKNLPYSTARLVNTTQGENPVGVIAAIAEAGAVVSNVCVVLGTTSEVKGVCYAGGLVGRVDGPAVIVDNSVVAGGVMHIDIRNFWDTKFEPAVAQVGLDVGRIECGSGAVVARNETRVEEGARVECPSGLGVDDIRNPLGYTNLVWHEEFDGSTLDAFKWEQVPVMASGAPNWRQYTSHRADLVVVSNGCLTLSGVKNDNSDPNETRPYLCGQIQSSGKFNFKYGVIELRAKFEDQDGAWPAMWMMPQNSVHGGWPNSGEIDISERLNSDDKVYQTAHFGYGNKDSTSGTTAAINNGEYNVYRLEWTESNIAWYVNGVQTHAYADPGAGYLKWPFDSPFYLILSQQLEGTWVGTVDDASTLPVRMYVDYVRVWQREELVIATAEDWVQITSAGGGKVRLDTDLVLDASAARLADFKGVFNGNGHTIRLSGAPLFSNVSGIVSNLNVVVVGDVAGNGTIAGMVSGNGLIENVSVMINPGVTITGTASCGGLVGDVWAGSADATASVRNCTVRIFGTLTSTQYGRVGGVIGNFNSKDSPVGSVIEGNVAYLERTARLVAPGGTSTYCGVGGILGNMNVTDGIVRSNVVYRSANAVSSGPAHVGDVVGGNCWGNALTQVSGNTVEFVGNYIERLPVALADKLVWLPIGDSITEGEADMGHPDRGDAASRGGYRYQLWKALEDAGQTTVSVGYRTGHSGTVEPDDCRWAWHAAQYGGVIMHDNNGSHGAAGFNVESTLEVAGYPDVITVLIGVNDLSFTNGNADPISWVYSTMATMVAKISKLRPKSKILVSTLLPAGGNRNYIATYNTLLRNAAGAKGAPFDLPNVELADINQEAFGGTFDAANFKGDTLHPNEVGAGLVGRAFAAHLEDAVLDKATNVAEIVSVDNAKDGIVSLRFSKALGNVASATLNLVGTNVHDEVVSLTLDDCRISDDVRVLDFACTNALLGGVYAARLVGVEATDGNGLAVPSELSLNDPQFVEILGTGAGENVPAVYTDGFVRYGTLTVSDGTIDANGIGSGDNFGANGPGAQFAVENTLPKYVTRVGYYVELKRANQPAQFVWVSMNADNGFGCLASKIGIPTAASGNIKAIVRNLQVYGSRGNFTNSALDEKGDSPDVGIVEFTPWNWTAGDQSGYPQDFNANGFGWNDTLASGYLKGGMQVAKILRTADFDNYTKVGAEMLFAYNNFNREIATDLAIGSFSTHRDNAGGQVTVAQDWGDFMAITGYRKFAVNAYDVKKIEIWAVPDSDYTPPVWTHFTTSTSSSPTWTAPEDGRWTTAGTCTIATKPIGFSVGSTASALTINLIATLPANTSGALAGWKVGNNTVQLVYNHVNDRFDVTYNGTATHAKTTRSAPADVTKPHVYTISITPVGVGTFVYQDGNLIVDAPGVKWNGTTLNTTYTIGSAVDGSQVLSGMAVHAADYNFSAAENNHDRVFAGYEDFPPGMPMSFALRVIAEATDADGNLVLPPIEMNGKALSGSEALSAIWMFGGDLDKATNFSFGLAAPIVENGLVGLSLGADDPINAALRLLTAKRPSGPWTTAAEIAPKTSDRAFVFAADDKSSFYQLSAVGEMTPEAAQGMPVSLTSASRVNLGDVTITADDLASGTLEVQLSGAGVAEGMVASIQVDGVALVAHATAEGKLLFDLSVLQPTTLNPQPAPLNLYAVPGLTNGDIRVLSPAVSGLDYSPAVLTAMVADNLYKDGFTASNFGWGYRIPALVSDGAGEVLCCYDVRYGGGDLGTGDGIDIGETYSADFGKTFAKPHLAIDVVNTRNEKNQTISQSRANDLGDVAVLYDSMTGTYWMMGMGGRGLNVGDYYQNDVLLYKREKGDGELKWKKVRSIQNEIAIQEGVTNSTGGLRFGFLEGPGHGFATKIGSADGTTMPKGTLVFPMQYFVDGWSSTVGTVYSKDHGATWTATRRSTGGTTPQENCVMELDDGSWYMTTKAGSRSGTGRINFFRTTNYRDWTYVGEHYPVPCQQGSCLRLGKNATDGKGRYVLCHTLHPDTATRARLALVFGVDTTATGDTAGIAWDFSNPLMLYYDNTGFKGYNSLCMVDEKTLGVLYEAQGHIYFVRIDVGDRLR